MNDARWHQVVLTANAYSNTQSMYLDGALVGTETGPIQPSGMVYDQIGAAYAVPPANWPAWGSTNPAQYFTGNIGEVSVYNHPLGAPAITQQYAAGAQPATELTSITTPNGVTAAQASYDNVADRATQVTDIHGGTWKISAPSTSGSYAQYWESVVSAHPTDFWPFFEGSGTQANNVVPNGNMTGSQGAGLYHNVTLGQPGPFVADPAAGFNGTTSYVQLPDDTLAEWDSMASISAVVWFKTSTANGILLSGQTSPGTTCTADKTCAPVLWVGQDGKLYGSFLTTTGVPQLVSQDTVTDGGWHQAVLSASPSSQSLYLDGNLVESATTSALDLSSEVTATVGTGVPGVGWNGLTDNTPTYFTGSIANVAIYPSALNASTVGQLHAAARAATGSGTPITTVTVTDPSNASLGYTYDPYNGGRLILATDGLGNRTTFGYDTNGFLTTTTYPDGDSESTTQDARGNALSTATSDPVGNIATSYATYPAAGTYAATDPRDDQPLTTLDADSSGPNDTTRQTSYTYNAAGQVLTTTTPTGAVTTNTYTDGTEPAVGGGTEPPGLLATQQDPLKHVTSYSYDSAGDLAKTVAPSGLTTTYTYDNLGRRTGQDQVSDSFPDGVSTTYTWDADNRLLTQTGPAAIDAVTGTTHTPTTTDTYDADGDLLTQSISDATGGDAARTTTNTYDIHDQLESTTDPANRKTTFGYDAYGNTTSRVDPAGNSYSYTYNPDQQLLTATLHNWTGNTATPGTASDLVLDSRAYDPDGLLANETDAMGRVTGYWYDGEHRNQIDGVGGYTFPNGTTNGITLDTYAYDAAGNQLSWTQADGNRTTYAYDADNRLVTTVIDPSGVDRTITNTYNAGGQLTAQVVANGSSNEETDYTYDSLGDTTSQVVHDGSTNLTTTWTYDQRGLATSMTDPRGNVSGATASDYTTTYANDAAGRLTTTTLPTVNVESGGAVAAPAHPITLTGYDTFGETTSQSDPNGNITSTTYDADGEVLGVSGAAYTPPGSTTSITPTATATYTALGQVATATDPLHNTTTNTYDQLGDLVKSTGPTVNGQASIWQYSYDNDGEQLSATDPTGAQTQATYDVLGQQLTATDIVRQPTTTVDTTSYAYNPNQYPLNDPDTITEPGGQQTALTYDHLGDTLSVTDPLTNKTSFGYDADQHLIRTTLPDGTATTATYDPAGRETGTAQLDATGATLTTTSAAYDPAGNQISSTDANRVTVTYSYDAANRLTQQIQPVSATDSITTSNGYDAAGDLTRYTDGNRNATIYTYNTLGLPESRIEPGVAGYTTPADSTTTMAYDANGEPVTITEPGGVSQTLTYDALGRMTNQSGIGAEAATATRALTYDADGRITSVNTPTGTNAYTYDDRGDILSASGPSGSASYVYNSDGQLTSRTDNTGSATFGYDADGRLATDTDPLTRTTAAYSYNGLNQVTGIDYGTGAASQTNTYNSQHELTGQTLTNPAGAIEASIGYAYDSAGHITTQTTAGTAGAATNTFTYDEAGRLATWNNGTATTTYGYDADGNRTLAGSQTATYNARDQLVTAGNTQYAYTARGTLASQTTGTTTTASTYDAFDQLATAGTTTYTYDGLGRQSTAGSATFTYDGTATTPTGDGTDTIGRGPAGELDSISAGGVASLTFTDQHGDLTGLYSATGTSVTGSTAYDPYGQVTATSGTQTDVGYQGGWTDPNTGYVGTASRWYDPATGAFTSRDTIPFDPNAPPITTNPYAYANGDPIDGSDPSGHFTPSPIDAACEAAPVACGEAAAACELCDLGAALFDGLWWGYQLASSLGGGGSNAPRPAPQRPVHEAFGGEHISSGALRDLHGDGIGDISIWMPSNPGSGGGGGHGARTGYRPVRTRLGHHYVPWTVSVPPPPPLGDLTPINPRPTGQQPPAGDIETPERGTKTADSGPSDAPVNHDTTALINPVLAAEHPYQPDEATSAGVGTPGPLPPAQGYLQDRPCGGGYTRFDGENWSKSAVICGNLPVKVWEPFRDGVDDTDQGTLPETAGIPAGASLIEGSYHFIVRQDGSLRAMEDESMWEINPDAGHTALGDKQGVLMAGVFDVGADGTISEIRNY